MNGNAESGVMVIVLAVVFVFAYCATLALRRKYVPLTLMAVMWANDPFDFTDLGNLRQEITDRPV